MLKSRLIGAVLTALFFAPSGAVAQFGDRFGSAVGVADGRLLVVKPMVGQGRAGVYVFAERSGDWELEASLHPVGGDDTGDGLAPSLAAAETVVLVGAADPSGYWAGHVYSTTSLDAGGVRLGLVPDAADREPMPMSMALMNAISQPPPRTVALDPGGRIAAVFNGSRRDPAVHVFESTDSGGWREMVVLRPQEAFDGFGSAVAATGDHVFVGAPQHGRVGAVVVFGRGADGGWEATAVLSPSDLPAGSAFGSSLAASYGSLWVGAPALGSVFEYTLEDGGPESVARVDGPAGSEGFGRALAVAGDELWVGAPSADDRRGLVLQYRRSGTDWSLAGRLQPEGLVAEDEFGAALALGMGAAVVGAPGVRGGLGGAVGYSRPVGGRWDAGTWLDPRTQLESLTSGEIRCEDGVAAGFECDEVDLLSFLSIESLGGDPTETLTDVWGWTDPVTSREYALVGRSTGVAIVDIGEPTGPVYVADAPANRTHARDIKVYGNHMFVTGDRAEDHGLLVFDLEQVRNAATRPVVLEPSAKYEGIASAHNLVIDTESGFAFTVGNRLGGETCGGGLHMVDIRDPSNPVFAGCYTDTEGLIWQGRTHDGQCVVYRGPDEDYRGRQICFALNETAVRIVDVTDKANPIPVSAGRYPGTGYIHQGWLTEDHRYFYQNDELDELAGLTPGTRTLIWDVEDLDDPVLVSEVQGPNRATDHNLYVAGNRMYQANYHAGFFVFDITERERPVQVGFFDTTPYGGDPPGYTGGAWTAFPFFESGSVVVSSMNEGLFILRPRRPILP